MGKAVGCLVKLLLLGLIGAGVYGWFFTDIGASVSKENYSKLKDGMSLADVEKMLGKGEQDTTTSKVGLGAAAADSVLGTNITKALPLRFFWKSRTKTRTITVVFQDDKLIDRSFEGPADDITAIEKEMGKDAHQFKSEVVKALNKVAK